jgi:hypothetical protein
MLLVRGVLATVVGLVIAGVDNLVFEGEVSPIVIVGLLLVASAVMAALWRAQGALLTGVVWLWLPLPHVVKKMLGLHDTLHPNTYASIAKLAIFSLVVVAVGDAVGLALRRSTHSDLQKDA